MLDSARRCKVATVNTSEKNEVLDNPSALPLISTKTPPLVNSTPSSYLNKQESLNSTASEKVSLMNAFEQSNVVQPLLTDLYQISMAYAYWKSNKHQEMATFDLYFRKNPFGGEYTLFAGLDECLKFIRDYKFHVTDIEYLRSVLPTYTEKEYFDYLLDLDMNDVKIYAVPEGEYLFLNFLTSTIHEISSV
ncbi:unnamed protein product [Rotaria socialis]|uniref:Nicotinate phosphoribosyltransferase N-terminal domain-containing protein n=2 Tax=Rotaria socialis TaxID=392032 RepID=A0A818Q4S2_9BILA|nr:unnamed protein product [Rotaria socialis]CAF4821795.1 unnamed protein product [Rotaria socialis]